MRLRARARAHACVQPSWSKLAASVQAGLSLRVSALKLEVALRAHGSIATVRQPHGCMCTNGFSCAIKRSNDATTFSSPPSAPEASTK